MISFKHYLSLLVEVGQKDIRKSNKGTIPLPIHFRHVKPVKRNVRVFTVNENTVPGSYYGPGPEEAGKIKSAEQAMGLQYYGEIDKISAALSEIHNTPLTEEEEKLVNSYTRGTSEGNKHNELCSSELNHALIDEKKLSGRQQKLYGLLSQLANRPFGMNVSLYSGLGFDPRKHIKDGTLRSPAFLSFTHDRDVALSFGTQHLNSNSGDEEHHYMHVMMGSEDKGAFIGHRSNVREEHETILPPKTELRYLGTRLHDHYGRQIHLHHFEPVR
jgi:hypothetical protein